MSHHGIVSCIVSIPTLFVRFRHHVLAGAAWQMRKVLFATDPETLEKERAALPAAARALADQVDDRQQLLLLCPAPLFGTTHQNGNESINAAMLLGYERALHPQAFLLRGECVVVVVAAAAATATIVVVALR